VIRSVLEKTVMVSAWVMSGLLAVSVMTFLGYLLFKGLPTIGTKLVFGEAEPLGALVGRVRVFDGIFPAILGTLSLVLLSTVLAVPMGVCSGIYLAEFARPGTKKVFGFFFDILAGIPSIVIGLSGSVWQFFCTNIFLTNSGPVCLSARWPWRCWYCLTSSEAPRFPWRVCRRAPGPQPWSWGPASCKTFFMC